MSGSSLDGLDIALCRFNCQGGNWQWEIVAGETFEYEPEWVNRLGELSGKSAYDFAKTTVDFAHYIGFKIRSFSIAHGKDYHFVASHGHTIFHQPERHFTAQIGDGETIATYLTCPLITNFRNKDVALGGQGAPLVPVGEKYLFPETSLFLNLGGIANLSILSREEDTHFKLVSMRRGPNAYLAFDVCACNIVLNHLAQKSGKKYDESGSMARSGKLLPEWLKELDSIAFYYLYPPRSLGREWVEQEIFTTIPSDALPEDLLHTYTVHIAQQIAKEIERFNLTDAKLLVTGGGAFNRFLMEQLQAQLSPFRISMIIADEKLIQYKEALIFAFLGLMTLSGMETTFPSVTGARHGVVSGSLHVPASDTQHQQALRTFFNQQILSSN